jgi:hypothetical protein
MIAPRYEAISTIGILYGYKESTAAEIEWGRKDEVGAVS